MTLLTVGLMSGTSADGIDCALCEITDDAITLLHGYHAPYPDAIRQQVLAFNHAQSNELNHYGMLDQALGELFAEATTTLLNQAKVAHHAITAIGSHGQTIRHQVRHTPYYTLQIADPNIIASRTGITTVADFRRRDVAYGGQGAPFTPAFHQWLFQSATIDTVVLNLGGIANITWLPADTSRQIVGFDTGPSNTLLDAWVQHCHGLPYDKHGTFAAQGQAHPELLAKLLRDDYFAQSAPKSTGTDYFNLQWLLQRTSTQIAPADIQATLVALTATTIADAIRRYTQQGRLIICGGGVHNHALITAIKQQLPTMQLLISSDLGIPSDYLEAMAFAWFASKTMARQTIDLRAVTGASHPAILGGVYFA